MKMIVAIIQPTKIAAVREALFQAGVERMTVIDSQGYARQRGRTEMYRGQEYKTNLLRKGTLEIVVNDDFLERRLLVSLRRQRRSDGLRARPHFTHPSRRGGLRHRRSASDGDQTQPARGETKETNSKKIKGDAARFLKNELRPLFSSNVIATTAPQLNQKATVPVKGRQPGLFMSVAVFLLTRFWFSRCVDDTQSSLPSSRGALAQCHLLCHKWRG